MVDKELAQYYDKDFWEEYGWVSCFECDIIFYDLEKLYEHQLIHQLEENPSVWYMIFPEIVILSSSQL